MIICSTEFSALSAIKACNYLNYKIGKDISIKDLAYKISNLVGFKGNIFWDNNKPDGTPRKILNISLAKKYGWRAKTSLKDAIDKTYNDYLRQKY